ncbi:phage portal protein [Breoghania sp. L-A4]|uniref:phage portal protein n=1 Tax=Breoghania sp. L-A4 TaxID=2304600 RepID=UPI00210FF08D|nr:phage portal protein [Breoghania sp. L-A4]
MPARELDSLMDAMLVRARVAALHAGFITEPDGTPPYDGERTDGTLQAGLEPGALINLPLGKHIEFPDAPDQGGAGALMDTTFRMIAAGMGVTYEQATGDYSHTNYSSARAALMEFRRFCQAIQHHVLVFGLCRPVWRQFIRAEVLAGTIPAASYQADRSTFEAVKWLPPPGHGSIRKATRRRRRSRLMRGFGLARKSSPNAATTRKTWTPRSRRMRRACRASASLWRQRNECTGDDPRGLHARLRR